MTKNVFKAIDLTYCLEEKPPLFSNVSFELIAGQGLVIEGPNGCGKSTLLRLLSGLLSPVQGDVTWQQQSIYSTQCIYAEALHYIGHQNGIKLGLTVSENLQLAAHLSLAKPALPLQQVLKELQLTSYANTFASQLSAGQKRRIALGRLLYFPKCLWILDEPLTALDTETQTLFLSWLQQHLAQGGIAILSSHHSINLSNLKTLRLPAC